MHYIPYFLERDYQINFSPFLKKEKKNPHCSVDLDTFKDYLVVKSTLFDWNLYLSKLSHINYQKDKKDTYEKKRSRGAF